MSELILDPNSMADVLNYGPCSTYPRDFDDVPVGSIPCAPEASFDLIPQDQWADRIRQMEKDQSRLSDFAVEMGLPTLHQMQTNYCHSNSPVDAAMLLRSLEGQPFVNLSPASVAGPITGYQNEGQFIHIALGRISKFGAASTDFVPVNQIGQNGFKQGWEANALKHRVEEYFDLGASNNTMKQRVATLLLSRIPICVAYNWWSHAVTLYDLVMFDDGTFGVRLKNSWGKGWGKAGYGLLRFDNGGIPSQAYAPRSVTFLGGQAA